MALVVKNPYDPSIVCEIPYDTPKSLRTKLDKADTAFQTWRDLSLEERTFLLEQGLEEFRSDGEEIARDVTLQMGKPITQSRSEIDSFFDRAQVSIDLAGEALATEVLPEKPGFQRRIEHTPLGTVLNIAAWNYPLLIPVNVIIPALLAGNVIVLKHSAKTPLCGAHLARAFGQLSVPDMVTDVVLGHEATESLIADPQIDYVAFTGSVAGGKSVYQSAAKRLVGVGLEPGGNDPAYIASDANLEYPVENVVDGACYNAGQSCCAVERVYVHEKLYDEFVERAQAAMSVYVLGDPMEEKTTMGPLASPSAIQYLSDQVGDAKRRGAEMTVFGGDVDTSKFFPPTLLTGVAQDALVMQEENFGPLLPVHKVKNDQEAIKKINDSRYGLTASIWTSDTDRANRLAAKIDAGTVYQNRCDYLDPALPWTGVKNSGIGSTLSRYGFLNLTRRKSIHFRTVT